MNSQDRDFTPTEAAQAIGGAFRRLARMNWRWSTETLAEVWPDLGEDGVWRLVQAPDGGPFTAAQRRIYANALHTAEAWLAVAKSTEEFEGQKSRNAEWLEILTQSEEMDPDLAEAVRQMLAVK